MLFRSDAFVEEFLGLDRGVRRLTFVSSAALDLHDQPLVRADTPAGAARAEAGGDTPWVLVVDAEKRPLGWADADALAQAAAAGGTAGSAPLASFGHACVWGVDSMRAARDASVLSPTGWAVGTDADGRVRGVISQEGIAVAIRAAHGLERERANRRREADTPRETVEVSADAPSIAADDATPAVPTAGTAPDEAAADTAGTAAAREPAEEGAP